MRILFLDLGTVTGWAVGSSKDDLRSGSVRLSRKKPEESGYDHLWQSAESITAFLRDLMRDKAARPDLCVFEQPLPLNNTMGGGWINAANAWGLAYCVCGVCGAYGIDYRSVTAVEVSKHLLGKGRFGETLVPKAYGRGMRVMSGREVKKKEMIRAVTVLGYKSALDVFDDNEAEAIAGWDWAQSKLGKMCPKELTLV